MIEWRDSTQRDGMKEGVINRLLKVDSPAIVASRLCLAYIHNDWFVVVSSCITLMFSLLFLILGNASQSASNA